MKENNVSRWLHDELILSMGKEIHLNFDLKNVGLAILIRRL